MRYDIAANADRAVPSDNVRLMLRTLLLERFHLTTHSESRLMSVYALTVGPHGAKQLRESEPDDEPGMVLDSLQDGQRWTFRASPLRSLIGLVGRGITRPLIDTTGLRGRFNFTFIEPSWDRDSDTLEGHTLTDVFPEVQRQLGLKASQRRHLLRYSL
jgi:bla regulator protein blaR1